LEEFLKEFPEDLFLLSQEYQKTRRFFLIEDLFMIIKMLYPLYYNKSMQIFEKYFLVKKKFVIEKRIL
jgi:hypothetical protein